MVQQSRLFQQRTKKPTQDFDFEQRLASSGYFQNRRNPADEESEIFASLSEASKGPQQSLLGELATGFFGGMSQAKGQQAQAQRQGEFDEQINYLRQLAQSAKEDEMRVQQYNQTIQSLQPTVSGIVAQWGGMNDSTRKYAAQQIVDQLTSSTGSGGLVVSMVDSDYNIVTQAPDGSTYQSNLLEMVDKSDPRIQEALKMSTMTGIQEFQKKQADLELSQARTQKYLADAQRQGGQTDPSTMAQDILSNTYGVSPNEVPVSPISSLTTGARTRLQAEAQEVNKAAQAADKVREDLADYQKTASQIDQILRAEYERGYRKSPEFTAKEASGIRNLLADSKASKYLDESTIGRLISNPQLRSRVYKQIKDIANLTETLAMTDTKGATTGLKLKYTEKRVPFVTMDAETKTEILDKMNRHLDKVSAWADYFNLSESAGYVPAYSTFERGLKNLANRQSQEQPQSEPMQEDLSQLSTEQLMQMLQTQQ